MGPDIESIIGALIKGFSRGTSVWIVLAIVLIFIVAVIASVTTRDWRAKVHEAQQEAIKRQRGTPES